MKSKEITQKRLKESMRYNHKTGVFTWRTNKGNVRSGVKTGSLNSGGYLNIMIDYKTYLAHRLAWLYVHGYLPENGIDHINRIKTDNRIENLREASAQCNQRNCGNPKNNTSGVKGIYLVAETGRWRVRIKIDGINKHVGNFEDFDEAVCHRLAAEQCVDWDGCDSCSPLYKYVQKMIGRNYDYVYRRL